MRPLTSRRPKPMLPVAGVPLLERLVERLRGLGVTRITVVVHHQAEFVRKALGDSVEYVLQESPRGTADALRACGPLREPTLVINGDTLFDEGTLRTLVERGAPAVTVALSEDPSRFGVVLREARRALGIVEKSPQPPSPWVNAGAYVVPQGFERILSEITPSIRGEWELTEAINRAIGKGIEFEVVEAKEWIEIGYPWDLLSATERLLSGLETSIEGRVDSQARLEGPVHVGRNSVVRSGVVVEGPVWIGPDCVVGPNAYLRPFTALSRGVKVGHACEIKSSLLFEGAHVAHLSYVGDSILGSDVNLGAGTIVANLRHDGKTVRVTLPDGTRIDTKRRKFGAILADGVKTGIHTTINAGVVLGPGTTTPPGAVVLRNLL